MSDLFVLIIEQAGSKTAHGPVESAPAAELVGDCVRAAAARRGGPELTFDVLALKPMPTVA